MEERSIPDEFRSSHSQMIFKIGVLRHFVNFTGKQLCWTILYREDLKRGTKRLNMKNIQIFHFTQPLRSVFTCPNSIIKTERHCAKYVQSKTKNKLCKSMCKTKFLQMCSFSITLTSLHSLNLPFALLFYFISTAIPKFPP